MHATRHEHRPTPAEQARYDGHPYHFRVNYSHWWSTGFGNGHLDYGLDHPDFTPEDADEFRWRIKALTTANMQAQGVPFDPATLVVAITGVVPLNDHDSKGH